VGGLKEVPAQTAVRLLRGILVVSPDLGYMNALLVPVEQALPCPPVERAGRRPYLYLDVSLWASPQPHAGGYLTNAG